MQYGMYINQNRCMGCFACVVACKDWHDVPAGPASRIRVKTIEKGTYPDLSVVFLPTTCYHCQTPTCVSACPVNAIRKRDEDGIVTVDRETCLGREECGQCLEVCPYDAPQFGAEENAKMQKCDLCIDRWAEGKKPICVTSCPMEALDAGSIDDLRAAYGDNKDAEGFAYDEALAPSITLRPKKDARSLAVQRIAVAPSRTADD